MAAFSYQYHPFLLDSVFLPNTPQFLHDQGTGFSPIFSYNQTPINFSATPVVSALSGDQNHDQSSDIVDANLENSDQQVTQETNVFVANCEKKRKNDSSGSSSLNSSDHSKVDFRNGKSKRQKKNKSKNEGEEKKDNKKKSPDCEEPPTGYIHVRARRGQATDSHNLAERVRREKISERMKILQSLVPGCDKVTGKALMLDEIINYVESLQNQVEFLSMRLASLSPLYYDFGMDLDSLMMKSTDQRLNGVTSGAPSQCSPTQNTAFGGDHQQANPTITTSNPITTTTNFNTANNYPILDNSASILIHGHRPCTNLTQDGNNLVWEMEDQRHKFLNPSGFGINLCSFH